MTDASARPAHQAKAPPPRPRKPQRVEFKGKPIGHESGRAQHALKSHEEPK